MTTPKDVDRILAADPKVIGLLADYVESRTNPKTVRPSPIPTTTRPTNVKPKASRVTATKPTKTKEPIVKLKKSKPKREGVRITVADVPAPPLRLDGFGDRRGPTIGRTATSAHDTAEATPCRVCGGAVERGSAETFGPWRQHRDCARIVGSSHSRMPVAARVLGMAEVDAVTAALVAYRVPLYSDAHREPTWTDQDRERDRGAWLHVDRKALLSALSVAATEREELTIPRPCESGPCAWCGVAEALEWRAYGHHRADGTEAPLCCDCGDVYERRGWPSVQFWDDQRAGLAEALTGVPPQLGESGPAALRAHAESEVDGDGTRWGYLPTDAVEAYRWTAWGRFSGRYAPAEHRDEAVARARAVEAKGAAQKAAREAKAARDSDRYGFIKEISSE